MLLTTKNILGFIIFVAAIVALVHHFRSAPPAAEAEVTREVWICPVHRDLEYNKPGTCRMCGRELIKRDEVDNTSR